MSVQCICSPGHYNNEWRDHSWRGTRKSETEFLVRMFQGRIWYFDPKQNLEGWETPTRNLCNTFKSDRENQAKLPRSIGKAQVSTCGKRKFPIQFGTLCGVKCTSPLHRAHPNYHCDLDCGKLRHKSNRCRMGDPACNPSKSGCHIYMWLPTVEGSSDSEKIVGLIKALNCLP